MILVQTGSRLHFGLLSFPAEEFWPNGTGRPTLPVRRFGGVGMMVEQPGVRLSVHAAAQWSAEGPLADRALAFAQRFAPALAPEHVLPRRLLIESCPPEHAGLGTGTQLGLAVARGVAEACGLTGLDTRELARGVGRGERSAIGVHGFAQGGLLVDGGKKGAEPLAPLIAEAPFPEHWPVLLIVPRDEPGFHGRQENRAFEAIQRQGIPLSLTESLCRLVLLGMLPALAERDCAAFGEALYEFNVRAGEVFAPVQGGAYAGSRVSGIIGLSREAGVRGVGQSSWGPTIFALTEDPDRAKFLVRQVRKRFGSSELDVVVTRARNQGAAVEK